MNDDLMAVGLTGRNGAIAQELLGQMGEGIGAAGGEGLVGLRCRFRGNVRVIGGEVGLGRGEGLQQQGT